MIYCIFLNLILLHYPLNISWWGFFCHRKSVKLVPHTSVCVFYLFKKTWLMSYMSWRIEPTRIKLFIIVIDLEDMPKAIICVTVTLRLAIDLTITNANSSFTVMFKNILL